MSIGSEGGRSPLPILVLVVVVAVAVWFLRPVIYTGGTLTGLTPTGAPTAFFRGSVDSAPRSAVLNYARSLDYDSTHGVGDYRRLMVGSCPRCMYGPHVLLLPERGAAVLQTTMLAEGRVVARLINYDADVYPKLNLAPHDTVYWWVDRRGPRSEWRSVYISSDPTRPLQPDSLIVTDYHTRWERTLARFLWHDRDEKLWVACDMTGCCRSSGADIY
ncbi:MAG: hypothetical protein DMD68_01790 [Gemmatimonadetes bacterium]|nr:MAG: hypothetical protein DMD68_01790 [Gemmatimonadota bacterium]